jgi:hypothetical protein
VLGVLGDAEERVSAAELVLTFLILYAGCAASGALVAFRAARVIDRRIVPIVLITAAIFAMAISRLVSLQALPGAQGHEQNALTFELAYGVLALAVGSLSWLVFKTQRSATWAAVVLSGIFIALSPVLAIFLGVMIAGLVI